MQTKYDYLIVGSGLFGATFAHLATKQGKRCLVIDKRPHLGGNVYCENIEGINVHKYGAHIFHTNNKEVWDFVNSIVEFNRYTNSPVANYKGKLYNLPFNMNTFHQMWGVKTPEEAKAKIGEQKAEAVAALNGREPQNLEEQALTLVGKDIFNTLIKEYTEKQWGRPCSELPAFIIKRLPLRFVFDNNYFNDRYQGIPIGGYNKLIDGLLNPSLTLPSREGKTSALHSLSAGEGWGGTQVLVGFDMLLNEPTKSMNLDEGGYREMADPMNYELLKDNAKRMRKEPTEAEAAFWNIVRSDALGVKFRRQHIVGNHIVDFICLEKKLVVEIDGGYHLTNEQQIEDNLRSMELKQYGFSILRLANEEVLSDTEAVVGKLRLAMWLAEKAPLRTYMQKTPFHGRGWGRLVYTGAIDEFYDFRFGKLDWRTVSFKTRVEDTPNYQGNAVVNYTSHDVPYTRVIEHKHFEMFGQEVYDCPKTVVSEEYSTEYKPGMEPYYPVNDDRNNALAEQYRVLAAQETDVIFGGRLAEYKYYDMAPIIERVMRDYH